MALRVNVIAVFSPDGSRLLLCKRKKPPYAGLYNFVGGKAEPGEDSRTAAYRELREETGITERDITLRHLLTTDYVLEGSVMEVYFGRLRQEVPIREELNPLIWLPLTEDFGDESRFAGCGNLLHFVKLIKMYHGKEII